MEGNSIKRTATFTAAKENLQNTNEASAFLDILTIPTLASTDEDWCCCEEKQQDHLGDWKQSQDPTNYLLFTEELSAFKQRDKRIVGVVPYERKCLAACK